MLAVLDKLLQLAEKIIRVISLRSILIWTFAAVVAIIILTAFDYRENILDAFIRDKQVHTPDTFIPSPKVKDKISKMVERNTFIVGAVVLSVDIRNNNRTPVFWYSKDALIQAQFNSSFLHSGNGVPLFTKDVDNNRAIISTINAEFTCGSFSEMGSAFIFSGYETRFPYVCNTSIPPFFGQYAGYMSLGLNREPTYSEMAVIKSETTNISNTLYFNDIEPQ